MNLLRAAEFKVGLLIVSVSALIAYMSMQISNDPTIFGRANEAWFFLPDAGGLVKGAAVKTAGIPVGIIKDITLQDGKAHVDLKLQPEVQLRSSATVELRTQGILGDKYLELNPGSPTDPPMGRGGQILIIRDKGSIDSVVTQISDLGGTLKDIVNILKESVAEDGNRKHVLGRIILNIEKLTGDVADMTSANKEKIAEIVDQVHHVTGTLDQLLNDDSDKGFKKTWKQALSHIDTSLRNIDDITGKINRGEGTIGRLVNDEETVDQLNTAIEGVSTFLDTANRMQTGLDFGSSYLTNVGGARTAVTIKLQPGLDRYYLLGVVDDPSGIVKTTDTTTTQPGVNPANPNGTTSYTETKTYHNEYKFNLQFAKNFYDFTVRGGIIDSYGGIGFDYSFFRERLKFSLEALSFSNLNLRTQLQYNLFKGLYVVGGVQDILNRSNKYSNYIGAGLFLTNDDVKTLMTRLPLTK
ncbi:MAG: MCE family protein [Bdellovibrio sp.]|nr:MAG: MCE family protein [Bdellovibrio sp.]